MIWLMSSDAASNNSSKMISVTDTEPNGTGILRVSTTPTPVTWTEKIFPTVSK